MELDTDFRLFTGLPVWDTHIHGKGDVDMYHAPRCLWLVVTTGARHGHPALSM